MDGFLKRKKKRKQRELVLLYVNIVNIPVKVVTQDFVMHVILTPEIPALDVAKLTYKIKKVTLQKTLNYIFTPLWI
ncbi:hypothetical protein [Poseidonibacter lekithochrous]|uniref:hypothetical protein n=1 Tax=Poseidonibacter lekithochrous TaxID=1904463 RepID=UPI00156836EC|nr:hypothetical protein [Poseidonibacter lekithochrous]QKJ23577.1 hypothetical protein ALEK_2321 [Poseidonibacter lekithochrous]